MKALWLRLILPLAVCAVLAFYVSARWPLDGLLINLSATFIGIALTVSYVDWILRLHEAQRWHPTDTRIGNRRMILLNSTISGIRDGLGYGTDILDLNAISSSDLMAMHKEVIRVAQQIISPSLRDRISGLDQEGWHTLTRHIANSHNGTLAFPGAFQSRLEPTQLCDLLDLQEALANSMISYTIFPDILGVPEDKLPRTRTPPRILQEYAIKEAAVELDKVVKLAASLSNSIAELR